MVRFDPVPSSSLIKRSSSKSQYIVSPSGKMSHAKSIAALPQQQPRVPSILIKKTTSGSCSTYETAQSNHSPVGEDHPSVTCSDPQGSNGLQQSPMRGLSRPIHKAPRTPSSSMAETNRSNFHRQFGNIFDEEMMKMAMNNEEDLNVDFFCIFCRELKTKDKDEARRHYQVMFDYPLVCSLCGQGQVTCPSSSSITQQLTQMLKKVGTRGENNHTLTNGSMDSCTLNPPSFEPFHHVNNVSFVNKSLVLIKSHHSSTSVYD